MRDRAPLLGLTILASVALASLLSTRSFGLERNFAGSG